ncbi:MAG: hypothetical protein RR971_05590 [Alistipes sp.]
MGQNAPPEIATESKPKRKYKRKQVTQAELAVVPTPGIQTANDYEALLAAEGLFDDEQLLGYYVISTFIRLYDMVKPTDRKELAKIVEGLVSNPRRTK